MQAMHKYQRSNKVLWFRYRACLETRLPIKAALKMSNGINGVHGPVYHREFATTSHSVQQPNTNSCCQMLHSASDPFRAIKG